MNLVILNDTRCDPNPGCQATMSSLARQLHVATHATITTRPRGDGHACFAAAVAEGNAHSRAAWLDGVRCLSDSRPFVDAIAAADLVVANLEGTFHHHTIGALALGGALAVAHRMGKRVWAVNGTVDAIDPWLIESALAPCEHVAVREPRSVRWLADCGLSAAAGADCAFSLEGFFHRGRPSCDRRPRAALYTPGVRAAIRETRDTAAALADLAALSALGWRPVFLQMEEAEAPVAAAARAAGWPVERAADVAWNAFGGYLRQFELTVSGRYHILIFAAMAGVPAVALRSNTFKIEGLVELLGGAVPLARHTGELRQVLADRTPPPAVDRSVIRRCQALACRNVPDSSRAQASTASQVIEGLDWMAAPDLAASLAALRLDGPAEFDTTIDTRPTSVTLESFLPVTALSTWRPLLRDAGFAVISEYAGHDGHTVLRLRKQPADPGPRRPAAPFDSAESTLLLPAAEAAVPTLFLVIDDGGFERLRSRTACVPAFAFNVVVLTDSGPAAGVKAWCRSRGIRLHQVRTVEDLDWSAFASTGALDGPECAFTVAARRRGWTSAPPLSAGQRVRVALFGASSCGRAAAARLRDAPGLRLHGFVDNDPQKWTRVLDGLPIVAPTASTFDSVDVIAVTSIHADAIARQVAAAGCAHKLLVDIGELEGVDRYRSAGSVPCSQQN